MIDNKKAQGHNDGMATRAKSPSRLIRDKALQVFSETDIETSSPVDRKYPPMMVQLLADACGTSRPRIGRWLQDPDRTPLTWDELQAVAAECGGSLRVLFSVKHV